jgi:hypothetical protein
MNTSRASPQLNEARRGPAGSRQWTNGQESGALVRTNAESAASHRPNHFLRCCVGGVTHGRKLRSDGDTPRCFSWPVVTLSRRAGLARWPGRGTPYRRPARAPDAAPPPAPDPQRPSATATAAGSAPGAPARRTVGADPPGAQGHVLPVPLVITPRVHEHAV